MINVLENGDLEVLNVVPVYRGTRIIKFVTSVSMADVNKVYDRLTYDVETQRGIRKVKGSKDDTKTERIMSRSNIEEMKYKLVNEFFDGGDLFWNVRIKDEDSTNEVVEFNIEEQKIIIKTKLITLPDSAQRHVAIHELANYTLSINQKEVCFPLNICLYTFKEEQSLFSEINGSGTKASKTRSLFLSNSYKNILLKEIIKDSDLKGNVEVFQNGIFRKDKTVSFSVLYTSLFDKRYGSYKSLRDDNIRDFRSWMVRFYNHLLEVRPELQKKNVTERHEVLQKSIVNSTHAWESYAYCAKLLEGDTNWKRKLARLSVPYKAGAWEGDLFSVDNPIWHGTIATQNKKGEWKLVGSRTAQRFAVDIVRKHLGLV